MRTSSAEASPARSFWINALSSSGSMRGSRSQLLEDEGRAISNSYPLAPRGAQELDSVVGHERDCVEIEVEPGAPAHEGSTELLELPYPGPDELALQLERRPAVRTLGHRDPEHGLVKSKGRAGGKMQTLRACSADRHESAWRRHEIEARLRDSRAPPGGAEALHPAPKRRGMNAEDGGGAPRPLDHPAGALEDGDDMRPLERFKGHGRLDRTGGAR